MPVLATSPAASRLSADWTGWRLTTPGWLVLGVSALLFLLGITRSINLFTLMGYFLLGLLLFNVVLGNWRLRRLKGHRLFDTSYQAGTISRIEVRFENPTSHSFAAVYLEDVGPAHRCLWWLASLPSGLRSSAAMVLHLPRRGWYDFARLAAWSSYPFGLVACRFAIGPAVRILVLPRTGELFREQFLQHLRGCDPRADRSIARGRYNESALADLYGLRPFRPGDSPRWVHWRTSARRGQLMVREFEDVPGNDLFLLVDLQGSTSDIEAIVEVAATMVLSWCRFSRDRLVLALLGDELEVVDSKTQNDGGLDLLGQLALARPARKRPSVPLAALARRIPTTTAVVYLGVHPQRGQQLQPLLHRPVLVLDARERSSWPFFQSPPPLAATGLASEGTVL